MGRGVACTWEIWQVDTDGAASGWRGGEARPRSTRERRRRARRRAGRNRPPPASPDLPGHARREREQAQWDLCRAIG